MTETEAEREKRAAPYGRNRNGVPNRPNEACVITVQCTNKALAIEWAAYIIEQQKVLSALPLAKLRVEDWPE